MKALSRAQVVERNRLIEALRNAAIDLESAVEKFNEDLATAGEELTAAKTAYNEVVESANGFRSEIESAQTDYYEERSEKWQESNKGNDYQSWRDQWAEELEEIEIEIPSPVDEPSCDAADQLDNMMIDCA